MVELAFLIREGRDLADEGGELEEAHLVLRAQQGVDEAVGGIGDEGAVLVDGAAGVDGEDEVEGQLGLALEEGDLLGAVVFGDGEVVFGEAADDGSVGVGDVDEDVDQLDVDADERGRRSRLARRAGTQRGRGSATRRSGACVELDHWS